jgi:2-polyprenyl-6-methoxyphenol hydroxylase-like FAD-dependent oxidoreductase
VNTDVLVIGAGPTGLVLALWLARAGIRVRIIDKIEGVAPISRALGVHARTLEFYRQLGFANDVITAGVIMPSLNLWTRGRQVATAPFADAGRGLTPFPFVLDFAQDQHELVLIMQLEAAGVQVERRTELVALTQDAQEVRASVRHADGRLEEIRCAYLAGCDGTHSTVRGALAIQFAGGTYDHLFYVADATARGPTVDHGVHLDLDEADLLVVFDMKGPGHVRLVGTIASDAAKVRDGSLVFEDVARRPLEHLHLEVDRVHWFSTYRVHHRVASRFRLGRAFLLGDAAHVHSPVGAQGMNTGIGDAVNLAWKLAAVLRNELGAGVLDTYEPERIAFARRLVATTDRAFAIATKRGWLVAYVRTRVFPFVVSIVFRFRAARRYLFRTVSQILINYRRSALSAGTAGSVHGGDRLPWVPPAEADGDDNFTPLASRQWQVHVYGETSPDALRVCVQLQIPLHQFTWSVPMQRAGLARGGLYLVRPDGYVAFASVAQDPGALRHAWERIRNGPAA